MTIGQTGTDRIQELEDGIKRCLERMEFDCSEDCHEEVEEILLSLVSEDSQISTRPLYDLVYGQQERGR